MDLGNGPRVARRTSPRSRAFYRSPLDRRPASRWFAWIQAL